MAQDTGTFEFWISNRLPLASVYQPLLSDLDAAPQTLSALHFSDIDTLYIAALSNTYDLVALHYVNNSVYYVASLGEPEIANDSKTIVLPALARVVTLAAVARVVEAD